MNRKRAWLEKRLAVCKERYERAGRDGEAGRNLALALVEAGRFGEAERLARDILDRQPDEAASWGMLAFALRGAREPLARQEREQALRQALALDSKYSWAARELAGHLTAAGRLDEAEEVLRSALAEEPDDAETHLALGQVLSRRGNHAGERRCLERALALRPLLSAAARSLAQSLAAEGEFDPAVQVLKRQIERDPVDPASLMELARLLLARGRVEEAERSFRQAAELDSLSVVPLCSLAWFLCGVGRRQAALALLEDRLAEEGEDVEVLCFRGRVLHEMGEVARAEADYRRALELDPQLAWARRELWDLRIRLGHAAQVLEEARRFAFSPDGEAEDFGTMAQAHLALGRKEAAEEAFRQALVRNPAFSWAARELARLLDEGERTAEAVAVVRERIARGRPEALDFGLLAELTRRLEGTSSLAVENHLRQALRLDPQNGWALRELAMLLAERGEAGTAEALLMDRARSPLAEAFDFGVLGWLLQRQGRTAEALAWFREALKRDPAYSFGLDRAVDLLLGQERVAEAEGLVRKSLEKEPGDSRLWGRLAEVLLQKEDDRGLELALEQALRLDPAYGWCACKLAEVYARRGDEARAVALLEERLAREAGDFFVWTHLARLQLQRDPAQAEKAARRALELEPGSEEAGRLRLLALLLQGRVVEARDFVQGALEFFPESSWPLLALARLNLHTGRAAAAEESAREILARWPDLPEAPVLLAAALNIRSRFGESLLVLEEAARRFPGDGEILLAQGRALHHQGRWRDAEAVFRQGLGAGEGSRRHALWLAEVLWHQGGQKATEGLSLVREALAGLTDESEQVLAAGLLAAFGDRGAAARLLESSGRPGLRAHAALLLADQGRRDEAVRLLAELPAEHPQALLARSALAARSRRRFQALRLARASAGAGLASIPAWFGREWWLLRLYLRLRGKRRDPRPCPGGGIP